MQIVKKDNLHEMSKPICSVSGKNLNQHLCWISYSIISALSYLPKEFEYTDLSKQCRPWSDAALCGVWSGSTLFAIHQVVVDKPKASN